MTPKNSPLAAALCKLESFHGPAPPAFPTDPFQIVLWENSAYLADDRKRREAFDLLRREIGTRPEEILQAPPAQLRRVTAHGVLPQQFAEKLREAARLAVETCGGDLRSVLRLETPAAKKILRLFPGIGEPGAEKILLFAGRRPLLAPDSNALRVLVRLGISEEKPGYAATYAAAREAAAGQLGQDAERHLAAHQLLRRHGQEICRRAAPECERCPLAEGCAHARGTQPAPRTTTRRQTKRRTP